MRAKLLFTTLIVSCVVNVSYGQRSSKTTTLYNSYTRNLEHAAHQYTTLMRGLPATVFPRSYENGQLVTSGSGWWCSGFYPGTLLYLYEALGDTTLLHEANRMLRMLEREQYNVGTHDLGFMMFCSFGNANRLHPAAEYQTILINSAKSLATRFNPVTKCIRSWDSAPDDFLVIIDNMMNLELLFWATRQTGDSVYHQIAVTHANTTLANHFRPDNSSYHLLNYDVTTGAVKERKTVQGFADHSAWARGQAWGLYGYATAYRYTQDQRYLDQAKKIAGFMLNHPNLPADKIPYWDFNAPGILNAKRDASAGAILASALLDLLPYSTETEREQYRSVAETILKTLSSTAYSASLGSQGGFILQHSVGHYTRGSEVDVPLTYADYYYIEALMRARALRAGK